MKTMRTIASFSLWENAVEPPIKKTLLEMVFKPNSNFHPETKRFSLLLNYECKYSDVLWYDRKELRDTDHACLRSYLLGNHICQKK